MSTRVAVQYSSVYERSIARPGSDGGIFVPRPERNAMGAANSSATVLSSYTLGNNIIPGSNLAGAWPLRWYRPAYTAVSSPSAAMPTLLYLQPLAVARTARIRGLVVYLDAYGASHALNVGIWQFPNIAAAVAGASATRVGSGSRTAITATGLCYYSPAHLGSLYDAVLYADTQYALGFYPTDGTTFRWSAMAGMLRAHPGPSTLDVNAWDQAGLGSSLSGYTASSGTILGPSSWSPAQYANVAYAMQLQAV